MKTKYTVLLLSIIAAVALMGCATEKVISPAQPASTNAITGVVTPAQPAVVAYVPNETVTKVVSVGQTAMPFVPAPWNDVLALALAVTAGVTTLIAKNAKAGKKKSDATAATIIKGVEAAGDAAAAVKTSIAEVALQRGTSDAVKAAVNEHA